MGAAPDSSSSDHSVPEVKVDMPPVHAADSGRVFAEDCLPQLQTTNNDMKRIQSNVGDGLRITFKVFMDKCAVSF